MVFKKYLRALKVLSLKNLLTINRPQIFNLKKKIIFLIKLSDVLKIFVTDLKRHTIFGMFFLNYIFKKLYFKLTKNVK